MISEWSVPIRLSDVARGPMTVELEPAAEIRAQIARHLGLVSLGRLKARLTVRPWLDGAEIGGRFEATVEQVCGVTLEPFDQDLQGEVEVRVVPPGSQAAPEPSEGEMTLDPDAPDPPDVLEDDAFDLAGYLVEHLALEIDPFPRKPGVAFEPPQEDGDDSPFAVLKQLKDRDA